MSSINIQQLSYHYGDGTSALVDIDLDLTQGSRTALVGPNGAGKTSLLLALAGLISTAGRITIAGQDLTAKTADLARKSMSLVFQNPDDMLFMPTVLEDVCFGLDSLGLSPEQAQDRSREALQAVDLSGYEQRSPHHLSYGEKRKVCLATCLARRSAIMLFDEPTRELDPWGRRNFIELFHQLEATLILATHDLELVLETCKEMVLLDNGRIVIQGDPRKILANTELMAEHRLEVPHSLTRHPHKH